MTEYNIGFLLSGYSLRVLVVIQFKLFPQTELVAEKRFVAFWEWLKEFVFIKSWEGWENNVVDRVVVYCKEGMRAGY